MANTKNWAKKKVTSSGIIRLCSHFIPTGAVILRYHSVQQEPEVVRDSIGTGITHSSSVFCRQIEYLARHYHPVTLDEILVALTEGKALPPRAVAITFDDGFRDNAEVAAPILNRFGVEAAFYVTVGAVENDLAPWYIRLRKAFYNSDEKEWRNPESREILPLRKQEDREACLVAACQYCARLAGQEQHAAVCAAEERLKVTPFMPKPSMMMSWQQIKMLRDQGHIIGSHTVTHPNMAHVAHKELYSELRDSKRMLEEKMQAPVVHFSYPSPMLEPHWTQDTVVATAEVGYKTATTCTPGNVTARANPLALRRMWVPFDMDEFIWYLDNTMIGRRL